MSKTIVTVLIKYDLFPFYVVRKGELNPDGSIQINKIYSYDASAVLRILPESSYEEEKEKRDGLSKKYDECVQNIRVDLLEDANVNFKGLTKVGE